MKYIADLHIHSKYSRATSRDLNFEQLFLWAQLKGVNVVGTGDFVHPGWLKEIKEKLEPAEFGFFRLKEEFAKKVLTQVPRGCRSDVRFVLSAEISNIYKKNEKVRKIHNVIFSPDIESAEKIQAQLDAIGNIHSDGRPILGLDSKHLLEIVLESNEKSFLIPAHIWTPWFSVLGSKSGFDRIDACYEDLTKHIFALETGLSSDPLMNWKLKQLDDFVLVSNSDAHSASKLAREANIFDTDFSYNGMYKALSDPQDNGFKGTLEFYPEEGKYHFDGHRNCHMRLHPKETIENKGICPVCKKPVTVGVMARVEELADREEGQKGKRAKPYQNLIPLPEIIAESRQVKSPASKAVQILYYQMLHKIGNELTILQNVPIKEIEKFSGDVVAEGVRRTRKGEVKIAAGYDGEFGTVKIFDDKEILKKEGQFIFF